MDLVAGFAVGFLGSLHCAGMCGPIALALSGGLTARWQFVVGRILYNAGRVFTYVSLGAILGAAGSILAFAGLQQAISITVGVVMLLALFLPAVFRRITQASPAIHTVQAAVRGKLSGLLHNKSSFGLFLLGVLNGFLPCGFLYVALGSAATLGDTLRAVVFLAGFGAGTIPLMLTISLLGRQISAAFRRKIAILLPLFTAALAILLILRGLNLGIPFISPAVKSMPAHGAHAAT